MSGRVRVFYFHGVVERRTDPRIERNLQLLSTFRCQVALLRRMRVIRTAELALEIERPRRWRWPAVVITFDDGFANNLIAAEILAAAGLPWTLFLSTGPLGHGGTNWTAQLSLLLLQGRAEGLEALERRWPLTARPEREKAFQAIRVALKAMAAEPRIEAMNAIAAQFPAGETDRLLSRFPSLAMLSWGEVSQLTASGVEVGSHGVDHEIHHADQPEAVRRRELIESKTELEARLGRPCQFFAYPNGDFVPTSPREVQEAGYALAFTTQHDTVRPATNRYLLPRLNPMGSLSGFVRNFFWEPAAPSSSPSGRS